MLNGLSAENRKQIFVHIIALRKGGQLRWGGDVGLNPPSQLPAFIVFYIGFLKTDPCKNGAEQI